MRNTIRITLGMLCILVLAGNFSLFAEEEEAVLTDDSGEDELFGGEDELFGGEDELFGGEDDMITTLEEEEAGGQFETILLTANALAWGGELDFSYTSSWTWSTETPGQALEWDYVVDNFTSPGLVNFTPALGADMYFDARPSQDFRVLGKFIVAFPFASKQPYELSDVFRITELFADYNWGERLFFRAGKHTITWGVGYYFSPADILNLTPIDPDDPEAEREGPLSLKVNWPFDLHNLYLYVIANEITNPGGVAYAPKLELVLGNAELGLGAYFRPDMQVRPRVMSTITTGLGDFDVFGEAVVSFGDESDFLEESETAFGGLEVVTREDALFFEGTLGLRYMYSNEDQTFNFTAMAQYLYNGKGYTDPDFYDTYSDTIQLLIVQDKFLLANLPLPARHYWAVSLGFTDLFGSDFSLLGFWKAAADGSGQILPTVSWNPHKDVDISLYMLLGYGDQGSAYSLLGRSLTPGLNVTLFDYTYISLDVPLIFNENDEGELLWQSGTVSLGFSLNGAKF